MRPALAAAAITTVFCAYIYGYAQMAGANYQRLALQRQRRMLQAEQQHMRADLLLHHNPEEVERWAAQHGFVRSPGTQLVLHRRSELQLAQVSSSMSLKVGEKDDSSERQ